MPAPAVSKMLGARDPIFWNLSGTGRHSREFFWYIRLPAQRDGIPCCPWSHQTYPPAHIIGDFHGLCPYIRTVPAGGVRTFDEWLLGHSFPFGFWRLGPEHHGATRQRHGYSWATCNFFLGRDWGFAIELPVAKKQRKYQRSDRQQLHDASCDERGQRRKI